MRVAIGTRRLVALLILPFLLLSVIGVSPASAKAQPPVDWSFYVSSYNPANIYNLGCNQANYDNGVGHNSLVFLDFGGIYTTTGLGTQESLAGILLSQAQVESLGENFAYGYTNCSPSHYDELAIGTNNSLRLSYSKGQAFARTVRAVSSWAANHAPHVGVFGANDIEPWSNPGLTPTDTYNWYNGYSATYGAFYFDYGAATTCPNSGFGPTCSDGWTQGDYYNFSWRETLALPLPEIYSVNDAEQWAWISDYGSPFTGWIKPWAPMNEYDLAPTTLDTKTSWNALAFFFCPENACTAMTFLSQIHDAT